MISTKVIRELYETVVLLAVVYASETGSFAEKSRKIKVFEMMLLRSVYGQKESRQRKKLANKGEVRVLVSVDCIGKSQEEWFGQV